MLDHFKGPSIFIPLSEEIHPPLASRLEGLQSFEIKTRLNN